MAQFSRHFTLDEANGLIPWVRSIFFKAGRILKEIRTEQELGEQIKHWPHAGKHGHGNGRTNGRGRSGDGGAPSKPGEAKILEMAHLWEGLTLQEKIELINGLLGAVQEEGIVIQDVERGLIDFPAMRGGEEILLCYELADGDRIEAWHSLESGYAGRQPIDDHIAR